jgi:hypothetical protein
MNRKQIADHVSALLSSANARSTDQGVLVFARVLGMLSSCRTDIEARDALLTLNQALAGIEAHGYLTHDEFEHVKALSDLARP